LKRSPHRYPAHIGIYLLSAIDGESRTGLECGLRRPCAPVTCCTADASVSRTLGFESETQTPASSIPTRDMMSADMSLQRCGPSSPKIGTALEPTALSPAICDASHRSL